MTDVSLPRPGYAANRSPSALAAAIALNGGVFALVIALPAVEIIRTIDPPIEIYNVKIRPVPPPNDPPQPRADPKPAQKVISQPKPVDTIVPVTANTSTFTTSNIEPLGTIDTGTGALPYDPPPPSVFTKARFNPRYADGFKPDYPPALRREGIEGSVTVRVTIDERGRVTAIELVKASDPRFFEETKRQALRYWRFEPARRDGVAVVSDQTMTVHFRLEDERA